MIGAAATQPTLYADDVFASHTWTGTQKNLTLTNNVNLLTKGGLVWIKNRAALTNNVLVDTVRGTTKTLVSNSNAAAATLSTSLTAFSSAGFKIGSHVDVNATGGLFGSWSFARSAKFFDIVTWTGDGTLNKTIPHGLKCQPGLILAKAVNAVDDWIACIRTSENAWSRGDENTSFSLNSNNGLASITYR